jgi:hypothetical protein
LGQQLVVPLRGFGQPIVRDHECALLSMTGADTSAAKRLFGISFISAYALENEDDTVETRIGPENARC